MKHDQNRAYPLLSAAALCVCVVFTLLLLYYCDNKYTAGGPKGESGILDLEAHSWQDAPVIFLTDGWAYYADRLLEPADLSGSIPDEYIFIGQYGGFDAGDLSRSPHGSASYRLTLRLPEAVAIYSLELPEIFTAYRAYVNGTLVQQMGDPDPGSYRPETGNRVVTFQTGGEADILIAVTDHAHLYSGMVYPPTFGKPDALAKLLSARLVFHCVLVAFALAVGLLSLLYGLVSKKHRQTGLFALLCLCLVGYTGYPILHSLIDGFYPFYAVEMFAFCAMLVLVLLLQLHLLGGKSGHGFRLLMICGAIVCGMAILLPFLLPMGSLALMGIYSYSITLYEWAVAAFLTWSSVRSLRQGVRYSRTLFSGILIFDVTLVMDRLLVDYEPIVTAWFPELASFALVLCIGLAVAKEAADQYRDGVVVAERMRGMERLLDMQRGSYRLLREQIQDAKIARHDLRHHFVVLENLVQSRAYDELERYLRTATPPEDTGPIVYAENLVVNAMAGYYARLARQEGVDFTLKLEVGQEIGISEADLCIVVSNLLENALEACRRQTQGERQIDFFIGQMSSALSIRMENSAADVRFNGDGALLSSKAEGRIGYGLGSIRTVAKRYNGQVEFRYDRERGVFVSTVLLQYPLG